MRFFFRYLKERRITVLAFLLFAFFFAFSFVLYGVPVRTVVYPMLLSAFFGMVILVIRCRRAYIKHITFTELQRLIFEMQSSLPEPKTVSDEDYFRIISSLCDSAHALESEMRSQYADMMDYYTAWAHQIKTPIAAMRLQLQNEDSQFSRRLYPELARIERYVEMVMVFLRLGSECTDYIIKEYDLDEIVRQAIKRFSSEFILRKISLEYEPLRAKIITDEKWLSFVIEQLLSNALKYTQSGKVSIYVKENVLCIEDTGIGISSEDLPRIFDKGYTGTNGRLDKRASGIGLYLCRRICGNLRHRLWAESSLGKGTVMHISLDRYDLKPE